MLIPWLALLGCSYIYEVRLTAILPPDAAGAVVFTLKDFSPAIPETKRIAIEPTLRVYQTSMEVCCSPNPKVSITAFIDANDNGKQDQGERSYLHPTIELEDRSEAVSINFASPPP